MAETQELAAALSKIQQALREHAKPGRSPELIAVSKTKPESAIRAAYAAGQRLFGENYAQELQEKAELLKDLPITWTYIGHLQSNKIKRIVAVASEIQTVASFDHAKHIARHAKDLGKTPFPIFIEVNAGSEDTKSGVPFDEVLPLAQKIKAELPELRLRGLMAIPPDTYNDSEYPEPPKLYQDLRALSDQVGEGRLSLGMSGDLRIALQAGSDFVRIGTAIFGRRS